MKVSKELLDYVKAENVKTKAWIAEAPGRGAGLYVEDEAHWEERGIFTLADLERDSLITYIYDGHKDAYGFRNRGYDFDAMSLEDLKAEADRISDAVQAENKRMEEMENANIAKFEALLKQYTPMAGSENAAIKWLLEGENLLNEYDVGFVQYTFGLPYSYKTEQFESVLRECR